MVNMCNLILIVINLNLKQDRQSDLCIFMAELDFRRQEKWNVTLLRLSDTFFLLLSDRFFNILRHHQFISSGSPTVTGQIGSDLNTSRSFCHSVLITHWICLRLRYSYNADMTYFTFSVCVLLKTELKVGATLQSNPERLVKLVSVVGHNWAMTSFPEWFKIESGLWKALFRPEWTTELFNLEFLIRFFYNRKETDFFFPRKISFFFQRLFSDLFFRNLYL